MLMVIWVVSLLISLAPIFGWKDAEFVNRVNQQHVCLISQQISYQVSFINYKLKYYLKFYIF